MRILFGNAGRGASILPGARAPECPAPQPVTGDLPGNIADGVPAIPTQRDRLNQLLTSRQRQIVSMLESGSSNKEIARALGLDEGTVKVHLHSIYQRIGVSNRRQLAAKLFVE